MILALKKDISGNEISWLRNKLTHLWSILAVLGMNNREGLVNE